METIKHLTDYFQKRHEKAPMLSHQGSTANYYLFEIPFLFRTERTR